MAGKLAHMGRCKASQPGLAAHLLLLWRQLACLRCHPHCAAAHHVGRADRVVARLGCGIVALRARGRVRRSMMRM